MSRFENDAFRPGRADRRASGSPESMLGGASLADRRCPRLASALRRASSRLLHAEPSACFLPRAFSVAGAGRATRSRSSSLPSARVPGSWSDCASATRCGSPGPLGNGFDCADAWPPRLERGSSSWRAAWEWLLSPSCSVAWRGLPRERLRARRPGASRLSGRRSGARRGAGRGLRRGSAGDCRDRCRIQIATEDGSQGPAPGW